MAIAADKDDIGAAANTATGPGKPGAGERHDRLRRAGEALAIPALAVAASMVLFGLFIAFAGTSPVDLYALMYKGAFGTWFSWQNTLVRASPLLLTALCVALPARLGLIVIGGEGALALGGLGAAVTGHALASVTPILALPAMALAAMIVGGLWVGMIGALRHYRGVNETISSLLLTFVAIAIFSHFVEGPLRDPASLNKPSTAHVGEANMIGTIPGSDVHWGLVIGVVFCALVFVLMRYTTTGFAMRIVGGNVRAARMAGLNVGALIIIACAIGGAAAGLAGMIEVAAVHGRANASLVVGFGFTGILVAFLARQNALAVIPVAILLGGIDASGGLLQRRLELPDAAVLVLQGMLFVMILASETLYGRFKIFQPRAEPQ